MNQMEQGQSTYVSYTNLNEEGIKWKNTEELIFEADFTISAASICLIVITKCIKKGNFEGANQKINEVLNLWIKEDEDEGEKRNFTNIKNIKAIQENLKEIIEMNKKGNKQRRIQKRFSLFT